MFRRCISVVVMLASLGLTLAVPPQEARAAAPACADIVPTVQPPGTPLRVLAMGDSITSACQWQKELSRLLTAASVPHVITTYAEGGTRCRYWTDKISGILTAAHPDLFILYCGTNDDDHEICWGESCTGWAFRSIVETVHSYRSPSPLIIPTMIGYSDATIVPDWLWEGTEPMNNQRLANEMVRYMPPAASPSWYAGIADIQKMPGTSDYLGYDGVHPIARGYATIGRIMYDAAQSRMGWPTAMSLGEPVLCGMSGHSRFMPRPIYTPCP